MRFYPSSIALIMDDHLIMDACMEGYRASSRQNGFGMTGRIVNFTEVYLWTNRKQRRKRTLWHPALTPRQIVEELDKYIGRSV